MQESTGQLLLRTGGALVVVIGLIYFTAYLGRRAQAAGLIRASARRRRIMVVDTARIGPDAYLHLVEVDGRTVLVAVNRGCVAFAPGDHSAGEDSCVCLAGAGGIGMGASKHSDSSDVADGGVRAE